MAIFECPLPAALESIPESECPVNINQIQKLAFQRVQETPSFAEPTTPITAQASWTPLLSAVDDTKSVLSPTVVSVTFPVGEPQKIGGNDNSTLNGVPLLVDGSFVTVPFTINGASAATLDALRKLSAETIAAAGNTNLWVYFFAAGKQIVSKADFAGFEIYNLFIPDIATEGLNTFTNVQGSFDLKYGWSEDFIISVATDFDPVRMKNP